MHGHQLYDMNKTRLAITYILNMTNWSVCVCGGGGGGGGRGGGKVFNYEILFYKLKNAMQSVISYKTTTIVKYSGGF